jgi:hypothetical protein
MYFKPGERFPLDSALKYLMVKSANDVAVAIAEAVSGTEEAFVQDMNAAARQLGMTSSRFINPNGLPGEGQYSTVRDMAVLAVALRREFPEYAHYFAYEGFSYGGKAYTNYNLLIGRFPDADGMKTGFICASGFNQTSSATRNGKTVVSVVFGAASQEERAEESARLLHKALTTTAWGQQHPCEYEALWRRQRSRGRYLGQHLHRRSAGCALRRPRCRRQDGAQFPLSDPDGAGGAAGAGTRRPAPRRCRGCAFPGSDSGAAAGTHSVGQRRAFCSLGLYRPGQAGSG